MNSDNKTHFGFQKVNIEDKVKRVRGVFDSVAGKYDLMNDLMSGGIHRFWKYVTIAQSGVRRGHQVLDLAGGTGDLTARMAPIVGPEGRVVLADINANMLALGRDKLLNKGIVGNVDFVLADAQNLPFPDNHFDLITISLGLRNVTDKAQALRSMLRTLKPGGKLLILEFSKPQHQLLSKLYDSYSFNLLPKIGKIVTGDEDSYRYLAESIRMHPDQETLKSMLEDAGFIDCHYQNMTDGIVALHSGVKSYLNQAKESA